MKSNFFLSSFLLLSLLLSLNISYSNIAFHFTFFSSTFLCTILFSSFNIILYYSWSPCHQCDTLSPNTHHLHKTLCYAIFSIVLSLIICCGCHCLSILHLISYRRVQLQYRTIFCVSPLILYLHHDYDLFFTLFYFILFYFILLKSVTSHSIFPSVYTIHLLLTHQLSWGNRYLAIKHPFSHVIEKQLWRFEFKLPPWMLV